MKNLILFAAILFCCLSAEAQSEHRTFPYRTSTNPFVKNLLEQQYTQSNKAAKTTNSGQRLISAVMADSSKLYDSAVYVWSGNRATVNYPDPEELYLSGFSSYPFYPFYQIRNPQVFTFGRHSFIQKPDTVYVYDIDSGMAKLENTITNGYNTNNALVRHQNIVRSWGWTNFYIFIYDANGNVVLVEEHADTTTAQTGNYILRYSMFSTYNLGKVVKDSIVDHVYGTDTYIYTYYADNSGKDTSVWEHLYHPTLGYYYPNLRHKFDYYPSGLLKSISVYDLHHGFFNDPRWVDSFGYSGSNTFPDYYKKYIVDESSPSKDLIGGDERFYTLNANGNIQNTLGITYEPATASWDTVFRYVVTYNSFQNPDRISYDSHIGGIWSSSGFGINYHYQTLTDVPDAPKQSINLTLHPNPTVSIIHLTAPTDEPATVTITNMQGRLVQQYNTSKTRTVKLDLTKLPAGIYSVTYETTTAEGAAKIIKD